LNFSEKKGQKKIRESLNVLNETRWTMRM